MPAPALRARSVTIQLPEPHSGQRAILDSPARFRVVRSGRRFGKTTVGIIATVEVLLRGGTVGWFEPTYKLLADVFRDLEGKLRPAAREVSVQEHRIALVKPGGVLECWSLDSPDPGRGRAYDLAVIDEAGLTPNLKMAWQGAIRPTLADRKGRGLFLGTSKADVPYFQELFELGGKVEGWESFEARSTDNPHLDAAAEIAEAIRAGTPDWIIRQEWYGEWVDAFADAVFDLKGIEWMRQRMAELETELGPGESCGFEFERRNASEPVGVERRRNGR